MTLIDQIRDLIAEGETERSLKELYTYVKENNADVIDKLVMLRSRMQNMQNALSNGTMDDQDAAIERAKINEAILKLLPQLTPEYLAQAKQTIETPIHRAAMAEKTTAAAPNRKLIYIIGGAVLLVVILIWAISGSGSTEGDVVEDTVQQEAPAGESLTAAEGTLLYNVLSAHAGYAVWQSIPNETNQQSIFWLESNALVKEISNNQVTHTFQVVDNDASYVTLYDPKRQLYLRISETTAEFHQEGQDTWNMLCAGEWTTPSNAQ